MAAGVRGSVVAVVTSVLFALSCGKRSQTDEGKGRAATGAASAGAKTEDEVSPKRPDTEAEDDALARAIDRKICRKRGCCVSVIEDAGKDRKGRSLVVATLDAGYGGVASCLVTPPSEPEPFGSGALDKEPCPIKPSVEAPAASEEDEPGDTDEEGGDGETVEHDPESEECRPYEYHLIVHSKGKIRARQLLSEACNNGYGAAGVGEDTTWVDAKTQTFTHRGRRLCLALEQQHHGGPRSASHRQRRQVDVLDDRRGRHLGIGGLELRHVRGKESWSIPDCEGRRKHDEAVKKRMRGSTGSSSTPRRASRPCRSRGSSSRRRSCRTGGDRSAGQLRRDRRRRPARLRRPRRQGECGGRRDARGGLHRRCAVRGDLRRSLDGNGESWVKEDHLELWLAPAGLDVRPGHLRPARDPDPSRQWGIRIADGQLFPAFGSPEPLAGVEVVRSGRIARARIPAAEWLKGEDETTSLTVVYSDSDDGLRQKRLIATSQVERGQWFSLGHVRDIAPKHTTCVVKGKSAAGQPTARLFNRDERRMAKP